MEDEKNKSEASSDQEQEAQADEQKEETTSPDAAQEANQSEESKDEVGSEDSKDTTTEEEETDYKAELAEKEDQLKKAEHTIVGLKKDKKEKEVKEEEEKEIEEKEDTQKIISQEVKKQVSVARQELVQDTIDEIINSSSDNPDERKLIKFHYENSIQPAGFTRQAITEDIENAKYLANKKRILKANAELRVSLKARETMSTTSQGSNQDKKKPDNIDKKFSKRELARFERLAKGDPKKFKELKEKAVRIMEQRKQRAEES